MQPFAPIPRSRFVVTGAMFVVGLGALVAWVATSGLSLSALAQQYSVFLIAACLVFFRLAWPLVRHAHRIQVTDNSISFVTLAGTTVVPMGSVSALRRSSVDTYTAVLVHSAGTVRFTFPFKGHYAFLHALKRQNPGASVSIS